MNGDESDSDSDHKFDHPCKVFYTTISRWASQELIGFLELLRAWHIGSRYLGNGKYSNGRFPHARYVSSRPESTFEADAAPRGLPRNWYDPAWLSRNPERAALLEAGPEVPLTLPRPEIM